MRHYSIWGGNYALIIPRQLREHLQAAGWSKADIATFIHDRARVHRREWADVGKGAVVRERGDTEYAALGSPDELLVVAAGGPPAASAPSSRPGSGTRAAPSPCRSARVLTANRPAITNNQ